MKKLSRKWCSVILIFFVLKTAVLGLKNHFRYEKVIHMTMNFFKSLENILHGVPLSNLHY